ncbi:MAG: DEAD/DEAH box helicase [Pseudomonadales bacterium]|nr:DEAD/DEAH box helicase [Pseudomonadales bacterium]
MPSRNAEDFTQALTTLKGVGPSLAEKFGRLHIHHCVDLLFHLPHRYEDRTRITPIAHLLPHHPAVIQGKVVSAEVALGRKRSLLCRIKDHSGIIALRFYYFTSAQKNQFVPGKDIRCYGEVRQGCTGLEIYHPEYELGENKLQALPQTLTPIYPATEGLTQQRIKNAMAQVLTLLKQNASIILPDYLPTKICQQHKLPSLKDALLYLHEPPPDAKLDQIAEKQHPCQQRLAFEELIGHSLSLLNLRQQLRSHPAPAFCAIEGVMPVFLQQLGFELTRAQKRVWEEISQDLAQEAPMLRLVQGDVGSGKTVIAALAAIRAIESGYQAAIMAPTEILAEQHLITFSAWLEPLNIKLG